MQGSVKQTPQDVRRVTRPESAEHREPGSATMQTETYIRKSRGRLSREDQRRLGDTLQRVYDDVVKQGVPERFIRLMDQIDQSRSNGETGEISPGAIRAGAGSRTVQASEHEKPKDQD